MLPLFPFNPKPIVGLDISPDEIRLLQLKISKMGRVIEKIARVDLPRQMITEGKIHDSDIIKDCIKYLVATTETHHYQAAIALPMHAVLTKPIQLSAGLSDEECEAEIHSNLREYFPGLASAELCFDYQRLETTKEGMQTVQLTAARQEQVNEVVEWVNHSGLQVNSVDVDLFAMARALAFLQPMPTTKAIIDINPSAARFVLIKDRDILYNQSFLLTHSNFFEIELIKQLKSDIASLLV